ncbi:MAG: hypothetical protein AB7S26_25145 [Sandaracinaceae bacterium]
MRTVLRASAHLPFALSLSLVAGCDDGAPLTDAGPRPRDDAGPDRRDSGPRPDAGGFDGGMDDGGGANDAGVDGGVEIRQSRMTVVLAPGPLTLPTVDETGAPIVVEAAHAFDHDTTPGETIFVSVAGQRRMAGGLIGPAISFVAAVDWQDVTPSHVEPDVLFAGAVGTSPEYLLGTFGSDLRLYDFATNRFSAPLAMTEMPGGAPFTPISATNVDLGGGALVVALEAGSPNLWVNTGGTAFAAYAEVPVRCSTGAAIQPDLILGAVIPGLSPPGADSVILIQGNEAYVLQNSSSGACWSDPYDLMDQDGAPLTPEIAFGVDYDGNGSDDLVLFDTIVL